MGQGGRSHHEAQHQTHGVEQSLVDAAGAPALKANGALKLLLNQAALALPALDQTVAVAVVPNRVGFQSLDIAHGAVLQLQICNLGAQQLPLGKTGLLWIGDLALQLGQSFAHDGLGLRFGRINLDVAHPLGHRLQAHARPPRGQSTAMEMPCHGHRQSHHGRDDDHALQHLGPGHRAHTAQKRTQQDPTQGQKNTQLKVHSRQHGSDQTDGVNLGHQINARAQDGPHSTQPANGGAVQSLAQQLRDGDGA